jgi:CMP-N-acetylneuraminic acid synthetase
MKDLVIVIPVLTSNRHFKDGDLKQISGISLVQWKINQIPFLVSTYSTYIFSKEKMELLSNHNNKVIYIERSDESIASLITNIKKMFFGKTVLWLNCNAPFVNEETIINAINTFEGQKSNYSSLVPVIEDKSFFIFNDKPLNFLLTEELSTVKNIPLMKVANTFYIFDVDSVHSNLITDQPLFYNIYKKESFELSYDLNESEIKSIFIDYMLRDNNQNTAK